MARPPLARLLVAAAVALVLVGCGSSDEDGSADEEPTTTSSTEAQETTSSTTSTSSSVPPSVPSQPTAYTEAAADAVNELEAAWETGDQARARAIAPGEVVDALFLVSPDGYSQYGCDTGEFDTSYCNFRNRGTGGYIQVTSQRSPEGWQIATIDIGD